MADIVLVDKVCGFSSMGATWILDKSYNGGDIEGEGYLLGIVYWYSINHSMLEISSPPTTGIIQRVP
jgi:hypothetical protein